MFYTYNIKASISFLQYICTWKSKETPWIVILIH